MSRTRYTKFVPSPLDDLDLDDLMDELQDYFLQSGFQSAFGTNPSDAPQDPASLMRALARILSENPALPEEWRRELSDFADDPKTELSQEIQEFLGQLIERLLDEGYLQAEPGSPGQQGEGSEGQPMQNVQFELTQKGVDLLGFQTLRHLLGSIGRSSMGRHDTNELSTGIGSDAASRSYEFGDSLNLDINTTLTNAIRRQGLNPPLQLEYSDLAVYQTEYQSSCATVLMLDCSHSMILYGEDRFTPAKKVALGLSHLIRTQYPGDTLDLVVFHDSAERIPLAKLPAVKVGPYHTNTCEGLRLAQKLLAHQRKDMKQILMITDGKPSALTLPNGRIYKNPFGLDPMILEATLKEVANCRKRGILINTFMVAQDYSLVEFVKQISQITRGKAYFATTLNLAHSILMDFMSRKTRTVH